MLWIKTVWLGEFVPTCSRLRRSLGSAAEHCSRISHSLFLAVLVLTLLASGPAASAAAQSALPTPTPALIALVVRAEGGALWNADDGQLVTALEPGERLNASARSADGAWFYAETTGDGQPLSGWVAASEVLSFNSQVLPVEKVTVAPASPTPAPTPTTATTPAGEGETPTAATLAATPSSASAPAATPTANPARGGSATNTAVISVTEATTVTVNGVTLNIRSGPGTGYPVVGKAVAGQQLTAIGQDPAGAWLEVQLPPPGEGTGWVSASYVTTGQPGEQLPVNTAPAPEKNTSAAPAGGGLHGKLVIQTEFGGPIYLYNLGSGEVRQLTSGFDPAISPDGTRVAFTRGGGEHGLYVINVDGSGERRIFADRSGLWSPKWSPDGRYILFVRSDYSWKCKDWSEEYGRYNCRPATDGDGGLPLIRETRPRLARVDTDGGSYQDIAGLDSVSAPDWIDTGIVYASEAGIQITSPTSQDANRKVHFDILQQYYQDPDWQPGGGRIVLQQRRPGHWEIFSVNPDGSGYSALTRPATALVDEMPSNVSPAWSPDGQSIVFLSNRTAQNDAGPWGVWVMNADGSNQRRLPIDLPFTYTFVEEQMLDWGP